MNVKEMGYIVWTESCSRWGPVMVCCEYGSGPWGLSEARSVCSLHQISIKFTGPCGEHNACVCLCVWCVCMCVCVCVCARACVRACVRKLGRGRPADSCQTGRQSGAGSRLGTVAFAPVRTR